MNIIKKIGFMLCLIPLSEIQASTETTEARMQRLEENARRLKERIAANLVQSAQVRGQAATANENLARAQQGLDESVTRLQGGLEVLQTRHGSTLEPLGIQVRAVDQTALQGKVTAEQVNLITRNYIELVDELMKKIKELKDNWAKGEEQIRKLFFLLHERDSTIIFKDEEIGRLTIMIQRLQNLLDKRKRPIDSRDMGIQTTEVIRTKPQSRETGNDPRVIPSGFGGTPAVSPSSPFVWKDDIKFKNDMFPKQHYSGFRADEMAKKVSEKAEEIARTYNLQSLDDFICEYAAEWIRVAHKRYKDDSSAISPMGNNASREIPQQITAVATMLAERCYKGAKVGVITKNAIDKGHQMLLPKSAISSPQSAKTSGRSPMTQQDSPQKARPSASRALF